MLKNVALRCTIGIVFVVVFIGFPLGLFSTRAIFKVISGWVLLTCDNAQSCVCLFVVVVVLRPGNIHGHIRASTDL